MYAHSLSPLSCLKPVSLFGAASGIGARDEGCRFGPEAVLGSGLVPWLTGNGVDARWCETLTPADGAANTDPVAVIAGLSRKLSGAVAAAVEGKNWFTVFGGDHTTAIGTWSGVHNAIHRKGPLGLIWIDAHMDSHTPDTSPSGWLHGMPLACLLGFGPDALTGVAAAGPALRPANVALVGVRSHEPGEAELLSRLGVRVFFMDEVLARGIDGVMEDALAIAGDGTAGFGLSIDIDAVDPLDAPGVGTPVSGGLRATEAIAALSRVRKQPEFLGMEIVEFNPTRDPDGITAHLVRNLFAAGLPRECLP